jgi:hypothetical protein
MTQQQTAKLGQGWNEYFNVIMFNNPLRRDEDALGEELEKVAQRNQGTLPGSWAMLTEANLDLETGTRQLFTNREDAKEHLDRARKNFERVEKESSRSPMLQREARFGLAQTLEAMGEANKAKEKYDQVARSGAETAIGKTAAARSKLLAEDEYKNFVVWFQQQKPKTVNPHAGIPGMGGAMPGGIPGLPGAAPGKVPPLNFDDLPQGPNINFPKTPGEAATTTDPKPSDDKPSSDTPDADKVDEKPADKPAPEAKSDAKADSEKPAAGDEKKPEAKEEKKEDGAAAKP